MSDPILLSPEEQRQLRRQARRSVGRVAERIHYVLLFARGYPVAEIATLYQVEERTVGSWLERYRLEGVAGLDDRPRKGRPRLAHAVAHAEAAGCLAGSPREVGHERTTWTRRLLRQHLGERVGCWLGASTLSRLIHRLGYRWRRPKLTLQATDPQAAEREAAIAAALATHPTAPRLYADACDVSLLPVVRGQYQRTGQQRPIPTPGQNQKQPIFGFLNGLTGEWHYWLTKRKRSVDFLACLHELYQRYPTGPILLMLDNASIHKSRVTCRWLANHPRLQVYYLPAYSGHQTNPVEKVWWALKAACTANHLYPCREALQDAIVSFFAHWTRADALRLTASAPEPGTEQPQAA